MRYLRMASRTPRRLSSTLSKSLKKQETLWTKKNSVSIYHKCIRTLTYHHVQRSCRNLGDRRYIHSMSQPPPSSTSEREKSTSLNARVLVAISRPAAMWTLYQIDHPQGILDDTQRFAGPKKPMIWSSKLARLLKGGRR